MVCQLLKLLLLLLSVTSASSLESAITNAPEMETSNANNLLISSNDDTPSDKVTTLIDASAKELITSHRTSKESKETSEQETSLAGMKSQEETSTFPGDIVISSAKDGPLVAALNVITPSNKVDTMTKEHMMSSKSTKESKLTTKQEATLDGEASSPADVINTIRSNTSGPLFDALNANTPSDKVATLIDSSTKEPMMPHTNAKESKEIPEKETTLSVVTSQEETSTSTTATDVMTNGTTTSKDPLPTTLRSKPANDPVTIPPNFSFTIQEDDKRNENDMTSSSHPSGEMSTQAPKNNLPPNNPEKISDNDMRRIILIVVIMVILLLILVTIVFIIVRGKRRRGSQSFQRNSSKKQDAWAGQVPELGDGKMTQLLMGVENGTAGNKPEPPQEQEMITFISAEKKGDSVVEVNELGKGDILEEKEPLLEDSSQVNEDPEKLPVQEQIQVQSVEQQLV